MNHCEYLTVIDVILLNCLQESAKISNRFFMDKCHVLQNAKTMIIYFKCLIINYIVLQVYADVPGVPGHLPVDRADGHRQLQSRQSKVNRAENPPTSSGEIRQTILKNLYTPVMFLKKLE